ncbi:MAG TPA: hypothetical protein VHT53_03655 [Candidatus Elarobacter sp.]|jgi:hypothetical protein|nr:hypothetical protein [Candidatus Elarobacter sp.]
MNTARWRLLIGYLVVIGYVAVVGWLFFTMQAYPGPRYETTATLARDHRIVSSDIRVAPWYVPWRHRHPVEGLYLRRTVTARERVGVGDDALAQSPSFAGNGKDDALLWIPASFASSPDIAALEPGAAIELCGVDNATASCIADVAVAAQWCDAAEPANCFVGAWVPKPALAAVLRSLDAASTVPKKTTIHMLREGKP